MSNINTTPETLFSGVSMPDPAGEQARSFSRDRGHSSMADRTLGGRSAGLGRLGLPANRALEGPELALGQGNQERLEYDNGLSQAGIQVVVVRVHLSPHFSGVKRESPGEVGGGMAVILAEVLHHFLQRAYFMKELQPLRKQHVADQAAHAGRTLAPRSLKIGRIKRHGVGYGSVVLGVLGQSTKQCAERLGQQFAKTRSNAYSLQGFAGLSHLTKFNSFIE